MTLPIDQIIANSEDAARLKQAGIVSLDDFWQARTVKTNLLSALFPNDPEASRRVFSQMAEAGRAEAANLAAPGCAAFGLISLSYWRSGFSCMVSSEIALRQPRCSVNR